MTFTAGAWAVATAELLFVRQLRPSLAIVLWLAGLVVTTVGIRAVLDATDDGVSRRGAAHVLDRPPAVERGWRSPRTFVPASVATASCIVCWTTQHRLQGDARAWSLVWVWLLGMVCAVGAAWQPAVGHAGPALAEWWARRRRTIVTIAVLIAVAAPLALAGLGRRPWTLNGDEGGFGLYSLQALDGQMPNPFGVGYLAHPLMFNALQAAAMDLTGETVFGLRLVSAIIGALTVPLAYLVTTRLVGRQGPGIAAALLLATYDVHLYWSRTALPNVASGFFVLLVLYLLDRALTDGRAASFLLTGLCVGLAQYFYFSNRLLVPVVAVALATATLAALGRNVPWRAAAAILVQRVALTAAGFAVAVAPLAAFYDTHRPLFNSRVAIVSLLHGTALRDSAAASGTSEARVVWDHLVSSAMLPFRTVPEGFYRPGIPLAGGVMAVAAAIGLAVATSRCLRPRWTALCAAYWLTVVGLALTIGPDETNRWVMAVPLVCVFAAIGLDGAVQVIVRCWPGWRRSVAAGAALFVAVASLSSTHRFFTADEVEVLSGENTDVAEHMAREIRAVDPGATVFFMGAPRMTYAGFHDLAFRTPDARGVDVLEPLTPSSTPPTLSGSTLFVAVPERGSELDVVRQWFPGGTTNEVLDAHGALLYTSYTVRPA